MRLESPPEPAVVSLYATNRQPEAGSGATVRCESSAEPVIASLYAVKSQKAATCAAGVLCEPTSFHGQISGFCSNGEPEGAENKVSMRSTYISYIEHRDKQFHALKPSKIRSTTNVYEWKSIAAYYHCHSPLQ